MAIGKSLTDEDIIRIAKEEDVDPDHAMAIVRKENSGEGQTSQLGAVGKFQVLPGTFESVLPGGNIRDPEDNARAGIRYLKQGLTKNEGDFEKAAQYYYAGPNAQSKMSRAPGKKYGTNPDGSGGISIEDYGKQAAGFLPLGQTPTTFATTSTVPGASETPGTKPFEPGTVDAGIFNEITALYAQGNEQLTKAQKSQTDLGGQIKVNLTEQMSGARAVGELNSTMLLEKFRLENSKAAQNAQELSRLGINLDDADSLVASISVRMQENKRDADSMRADIEDRAAIGPLDNPLQWIINRFTLPADIKRHNAKIRAIEADKHFVDQATSTAVEVSQANSLKYASTTAAGAQAAADLQKQIANNNALVIQDKLMQTDFGTQVKGLELIQGRIQALNGMLNSQQLRESRDRVEQEKIIKANMEKLDDSKVQLAASSLGYDVKSRKELQSKGFPTNVQQAIERVAAGGGIVSTEPLESWQILMAGDYNKMPATTQQQRDRLTLVMRQSEEAARTNQQYITITDPKKKQEFINAEMNRRLQDAYNNPGRAISTGYEGKGGDNPYSAPTPKVMLNLPEIKKLKMSGVLQEQLKTLPNTQITDSMVAELAYSQVGPGKVYNDITEAAKDVADYYSAAIKRNNEVMHFSHFGMPDQQIYRVSGVDLTNQSQITKMYLKRQRETFGLQQIQDISPFVQ